MVLDIKNNIEDILSYLKKQYRYFSIIDNYNISINKDNPNKIIINIELNINYNNKYFIIEYTKKDIVIKDNNESVIIYSNNETNYNRYKNKIDIKLLNFILDKLKEEIYFQINNISE